MSFLFRKPQFLKNVYFIIHHKIKYYNKIETEKLIFTVFIRKQEAEVFFITTSSLCSEIIITVPKTPTVVRYSNL